MVDEKQLRNDQDDEIDLGELLNVLIRRRWLVALIFVFVLCAGVAYALIATPIYKADALIQVEDKKNASLGGLSILSESLGIQQSPVAGEIEILRSREVLMKAIDQTHAAVNISVDDYFPVIGQWLARRNIAQNTEGGLAPVMWGLSGYAWGGEQLEFALLDLPRNQLGKPFYLELTDEATGAFVIKDAEDKVLTDGIPGQKLTFKIGGSEASIAVKTVLARKGITFVFTKNSPIVVYNQLRSGLNISEQGKQSSIIAINYEDSNDAYAVDIVNAVAQAYLEQNVERRSVEARSSLKFLETQLPELKQKVDLAEDALSEYRSSSNTIAIDKEAEGLLSQAITLENKRLELKLKRDEMLLKFKPQHPQIKILDKQFEALDEAVSELDAHIDALPRSQRELIPFERDARVNTALYTSLLNNAQELRVAEAGTVGNVRIIDYAISNERPVKPKKLLIVAIAGLLGLFLGIFAAFLAHFLRPAIQRSEQIEQATGLNTYVTIPESETQAKFAIGLRGRSQKSGNQLLVTYNPSDFAVESLRSLRTSLNFALMGAKGKTIAITGATQGVGKSFIAANFASLLSSVNDKRVVLIDCDMRRPRLSYYFSYNKKDKGLSNYLANEIELDSLIINEAPAGIDVIPAGSIPPNPGELLLSDRFGELISKLEQDYDLIVLDTPPILPVADVLAIMRYVTVGFIVARAEQSTTAELNDALAKLRNAGCADAVKGVIFNGVKRNRVGYGSSYKYYYSYK